MPTTRLTSWLPIAGVLVAVAGGLGWLLLGFGNERGGQRPLPDAAGSSLEWLLDEAGDLTLAEVKRMPAARWKRAERPRPFFWPGGDVVWVRATLRNPDERALRAVLADADYFLDRVEAWVLEERRLQSGEAVSTRDKALAGREVAFPVTVPARGECVVYLRIQDRLGLFMWWTWWPSQAEFQTMQMRGLLAEGLYLGVLAALFGYNVLLWVRLRLADIGWYVLYLGTIAVFIVLARAHVVALGWPLSSPGLETALVMGMGLSGFVLTQFARTFLELKTQPAAAHWLTRGLQILGLGIVVGALTTPWLNESIWLAIAVPASGLTHAVLFAIAVWSWGRGVRQARYFVLSFGCLFAGTLPTAAAWIWQQDLKAPAMLGMMIGSALEMLLLSLATADRFAQAQRRLVEETEQRRAIQEAYADELATEVRERTRELEQANTDKDRMLAVIGHDLRSPLTGLMKSADRVEGDFARDTARTGRALLLMIEDLVLWARLRAGTRVVSSHPARALLAPAVALHRALAEGGGTALALEVRDGLRVETDLVLAQTLVRNLLANALKFAATRVVLRAADDGAGGVRFTVSNDGVPLPAAVVARLAADENEPMTAVGGLGLRLCREICAALEMRLEARAPAEGGAEFNFTLHAAENFVEENT